MTRLICAICRAPTAYRLNDLPPREGASPLIFELVSEVAGQRRRFPLPVGT